MSKNSSRSSKKNMIPLYVVFSLSIWITGHTCSDLHTTSLFFTSGTWGICTSPSSACPQPPLPLVLAHHIPPTYAGELERVWLAEKEKKIQLCLFTLSQFPCTRWQRRAFHHQPEDPHVWIFLLKTHRNRTLGAMKGMQCIKYLVFVFNFLFWVCRVTLSVSCGWHMRLWL